MGTVIQRTVVDWRSYISEPWQKAVENILETGRRLLEAKKSTSHGDWEKIFENNEPFSERTAQRLMAIARHPILAKAAHGPLLPPSWRTLYELSLVPEPLLLELIQDTKVHPDLKRLEVKELVKETQPPMLTEQDIQQRVNQAVAEAQRKAQEQEKAAVANARETTKKAYTELVADLQRNLKITKDYYVDDMRKLQEEVKKGVAPAEVQKKIDAATLALKNQNAASNKAISELQAKIDMLENDKVERAKEVELLKHGIPLRQPGQNSPLPGKSDLFGAQLETLISRVRKFIYDKDWKERLDTLVSLKNDLILNGDLLKYEEFLMILRTLEERATEWRVRLTPDTPQWKYRKDSPYEGERKL